MFVVGRPLGAAEEGVPRVSRAKRVSGRNVDAGELTPGPDGLLCSDTQAEFSEYCNVEIPIHVNVATKAFTTM